MNGVVPAAAVDDVVAGIALQPVVPGISIEARVDNAIRQDAILHVGVEHEGRSVTLPYLELHRVHALASGLRYGVAPANQIKVVSGPSREHIRPGRRIAVDRVGACITDTEDVPSAGQHEVFDQIVACDRKTDGALHRIVFARGRSFNHLVAGVIHDKRVRHAAADHHISAFSAVKPIVRNGVADTTGVDDIIQLVADERPWR